MRSPIYLVFIFLLLNTSCKNEKVSIVTVKLNRSDFVEKLNVTGTVQAVNSRSVLAPRSNYGTMTVVRLAADGAIVKKGDTICTLSTPDILNIYENLLTTLQNTEADLKKNEADNTMNLSLLEAQVETNKAQMEISSLDSIQMKFAPPVKQKLLALELEKAKVEKRKLEKKFASQKIIDESEIRQTKSRIIQQQTRIQTIKEQIDAFTVIASEDGMVMHSEAPKMIFGSSSGSMSVIGGKIEIGSLVFSRMPVLQFPDLSKMQVSVEIAEGDFRKLEKGQPVSVEVEAGNNLLTTGKVSRKSLISRNRQRDSKVKTYEAIIDIDSCHTKMKPGLSATCEITISQIKDTIVVPTLAIFERDSLRTVYVQDGKFFKPVTIETGSSNSSYTIISRGLAGNETIAMSEPPHNLIKKAAMPDVKNTGNSIKPDSLKK